MDDVTRTFVESDKLQQLGEWTNSHEFTTVPKDRLADACLLQLGAIVCYFADIEESIHRYIRMVTTWQSLVSTDVLLSELSFKALAKAMAVYDRLIFGETEELTNLCSLLQQAEDTRNRLMHSWWWAYEETNAWRFKEFNSRSKLKTQKEVLNQDELKAIAEAFRTLAHVTSAFSMERISQFEKKIADYIEAPATKD